jgi:hypothetical protein
VISLADAGVLIGWGLLHLGKSHREQNESSSHDYRRDGYFLIILGVFALIAYFIGHYTEQQLKAEIAAANERTQALERDNLVLRSDVNKATGEVATLQKDAADARTAQQRVETELARQQERAANAEKALLELQEQRRPRVLTAQQRSDFAAVLRGSQPGEKIQLGCAIDSDDAYGFAYQFLTLFREVQWPVEHDRIDRMTTENPTTGIVLFKRGKPVQSSPLWSVETTPMLDVLKRAFAAIGINAEIIAHTTLEEGKIQIYVGGKPQKP